ncbi:MAG: TrbC/VirB2 family protein [Lysobacter sp.]|nr:TrbC/VirB2 family protein [Lysobacter sp.]
MKIINHDAKRHLSAAMTALVFVAALALPNLAFAFAGSDGKACGFMQNITSILNIVSLAVVTIAIIFAGYQIAFAHKRISDVAPILIGGLLIGAAGQIAKMLLGSSASSDCTGEGDIFAIVNAVLPLYA